MYGTYAVQFSLVIADSTNVQISDIKKFLASTSTGCFWVVWPHFLILTIYLVKMIILMALLGGQSTDLWVGRSCKRTGSNHHHHHHHHVSILLLDIDEDHLYVFSMHCFWRNETSRRLINFTKPVNFKL